MKPVVVVGPHRSGTSVTTRVLSLLGLVLCAAEDLMVKEDNPAGHWESRSLMELNDELLASFDGTWYAPPELPPSWEKRGDLAALRERAIERFYRVHPKADWVWKDPRLCLLLPFWTAALGIEPVVVLTVRHPIEIARSLVARDRFGMTHALAIWERYAVAMLASCAGRPVVVARYDALLADPRREVSRLRDALDTLGADVSGADVDAAAGTVEKRYRHHHAEGTALLTRWQEGLHQLLHGLEPAYETFSLPEVPRLSEPAAEILAARRRIRHLEQEVEERNAWARGLDAEVQDREAAIRDLQAEVETRTAWAVGLDGELRSCRERIQDQAEEIARLAASAARSSRIAGLETITCSSREELLELRHSEVSRRRYMLEVLLARQHRDDEAFELPGFCLLDEAPVAFRVDWLYSQPPVEIDWLSSDGTTEELKLPNWRERMVCPRCGMNSRQRAIAATALGAIRRRRSSLGRDQRLYLTEGDTPMFRFFRDRVPGAECLGSHDLHELFERRPEGPRPLGFENASLDLVLSCSVLEHVDEPLGLIGEMARILRPGGELFLEVPLDLSRENNVRRARIVDGKIEHLLPPEFRADPPATEGRGLVITEFGWELVEGIRSLGGLACEAAVYWSFELGHLGGDQMFFHARRSQDPS